MASPRSPGTSEDALLALTARALQTAHEDSINEWKNDIKSLFDDAENRFPDIVWKTNGEDIWGHKAIVWAKNIPVNSRARLSESDDHSINSDGPSNLEEAYEDPSSKSAQLLRHGFEQEIIANPEPEVGGRFEILANPSSDRESLIKDILAAYTVDDGTTGDGTVTGTIEDQNDHGAQINDTILFQESLITAWRRGLYVDIQFTVPWFGQESEHHGEHSTPRFMSHRCILVSRSPVCRSLLMENSRQKTAIILKTTRTGAPLIALPFPPFTPASFYFILGYIYTGLINFRHQREFDLQTAFSIVRGSIYLSMPTLQKHVVAHIAVEMLHGLFHAYLSNSEYLRIFQGSWRKMSTEGGCQCNSCITRIPRVLRFALGSNLHSYVLQRGARRALVGIFGRGWCTHEFAAIPRHIRLSIEMSVLKMVVPQNALALLFSAERGLKKLDEDQRSWDVAGVTIGGLIAVIRNAVDKLLCTESQACFESEDWRVMMILTDAATDEEVQTRNEQAEWLMLAILRAVQPLQLKLVYQTFDSLVIPENANNFFLKAIIEHIKSELLVKMGPMLSPSILLEYSRSTQLSFANVEPVLVFDHDPQKDLLQYNIGQNGTSQQWKRYTESIYSNISEQTIPWSIDVPPSEASSADGILALDLANISVYSHASSRTLSTDYGLFYTRHALSLVDDNSSSILRRRRSWDSFMSNAY